MVNFKNASLNLLLLKIKSMNSHHSVIYKITPIIYISSFIVLTFSFQIVILHSLLVIFLISSSSIYMPLQIHYDTMESINILKTLLYTRE